MAHIRDISFNSKHIGFIDLKQGFRLFNGFVLLKAKPLLCLFGCS